MRRLIAFSAAVILAALAVPASAAAHPMSTSAVLLDVGGDEVTGEIQLPVDRLAVGLQRKLSPAQALEEHEQLEAYTRSHIAATGVDGERWSVAVGDGRIGRVDNVQHLVMDLTLTPPGGEVTDFDLRYDVIVHQLVTHKIVATIRQEWDQGTLRDPKPLGIFDYATKTLRVDAGGGSWLAGVTAMGGLGVDHIAEGADHLLFLLMLLIPAPLVAAGGRWRRRDDAGKAALRVVHVVTAFALGHSITLALATFDVVALPTRLVESLIAFSILVSAVHALRPLARGGEAIIAVGFGFVHGLAFAEILAGYGLSGGTLVSSLLGFNLGIEVTQLLVVALMMPSLYVLSRTRFYTPVRVGVAALGIVLSAGWLLERTTILGSDPFESVSTTLVEHPFAVASAFVLMALLARYLPTPRPPSGALPGPF